MEIEFTRSSAVVIAPAGMVGVYYYYEESIHKMSEMNDLDLRVGIRHAEFH